MGRLKVFGGNSFRHPNRRQCRTIIATTSQKRAAELMKMSLYEFRDYWCETGNQAEIDAAMKRPEVPLFATTVIVYLSADEVET